MYSPYATWKLQKSLVQMGINFIAPSVPVILSVLILSGSVAAANVHVEIPALHAPRRCACEVLEENARNSLDEAKRLFGADNVIVAYRLNELARVHIMQGKAKQSEKELLQALKMEQQKLPADDPNICNSMAMLASAYDQGGEATKSKRYEDQSLAIYRRNLSAGKQIPLAVFDQLTENCMMRRDVRAAVTIYERGLQQCKREFGSTSAQLAVRLETVAMLHLAAQREEDAAADIEQALAIRGKQKNSPPAQIFWDKQFIVNSLIRRRRFNQAADYLIACAKVEKTPEAARNWQRSMVNFAQGLKMLKQDGPANRIERAANQLNTGLNSAAQVKRQ